MVTMMVIVAAARTSSPHADGIRKRNEDRVESGRQGRKGRALGLGCCGREWGQVEGV